MRGGSQGQPSAWCCGAGGPGLLRVAPPIPSVTGTLSVLAGPLFCHQRRGDRSDPSWWLSVTRGGDTGKCLQQVQVSLS